MSHRSQRVEKIRQPQEAREAGESQEWAFGYFVGWEQGVRSAWARVSASEIEFGNMMLFFRRHVFGKVWY